MTDKEKSILVQQFGEKVSRLSHRMIWNSELAKEAAQEVWYEILRSVDSFKSNSDISTWIYTITKRTVLRFAQSERTLSAIEYDTHFNLEDIDYSGDEEEKEQWVKDKCDYCLTAFCHCLSNDARLIFLFRDLAELSDARISKVMDLSEENIRKIASRAKEKVRNFMNKDCVLYNQHGKCRCRIQKHVHAVQLDKEYHKLAKGIRLIDLFHKFDKDLPRKNYWEKNILEVVTN